jgi:hypothetical protein
MQAASKFKAKPLGGMAKLVDAADLKSELDSYGTAEQLPELVP